MHVSNSELRVFSSKAALGAGLPIGVAENFGLAVSWLAYAGFEGPKIACRAINSLAEGRSGPAKLVRKQMLLWPDNNFELSSALYVAPSVSDFLQTQEHIEISRLDEPLLLFAHLICSASVVNRKLALSLLALDKGPFFAIIHNGNGRFRNELFPKDAEEFGFHVNVQSVQESGVDNLVPTRSEVKFRERSTREGVNVNEESWHELQRLFARTLVPETFESREKGAGAGLLDND